VTYAVVGIGTSPSSPLNVNPFPQTQEGIKAPPTEQT